MMSKSLSHSRLIYFDSEDDIIDFANTYGPEHMILNHRHADALASRVRSAGSVFIGSWTPESAGDYASGTNHTLPTSGYAHAYSGVNLDSFIKKITFQHITPDGVRSIGNIVAEMARAEDLCAHELAMTLRLNRLNRL
jgi:histidinol dehydrogenase